jgi:UDP-N-acetylglucosamine acyltransferase
MPEIHPTAIVSSESNLADDVVVGPYAIIGAGVAIGAGTQIGPFSRIEGHVTIGERNLIIGQSSIGTPPQDLKFKGERTELVIGNDNTIREFCTFNRGTAGGGGITTIGSNNFFMAYSHVAHDCHIGENVIFANNATLAGHVDIADFATIGAFTAIHQFCRVGEHAFIGGGSICTQDVLPFVKTVGNRPAKTYGINTIGLQRKGFPPETIEALQRAYRLLIRSKLRVEEATARIEEELGLYPEARYFVEFVRGAKRGVIR